MPQPRILVVTSCTGEKRFKPNNPLTLEDFKEPIRLQQREAELAEFACPAGQMYTGMQHLQLMEGVQLMRKSLGQAAIDVAILSAGYGLVEESRVIVPYEATFNNMKVHEVVSWGQFLKIHHDFRHALQNYDLIFVLLGEKYLQSVSLPVATHSNQTLIFLASKGGKKLIGELDANTFIWPLSNQEAQQWRYGLVGLKGFLFKEFAKVVLTKSESLFDVYKKPELFKLLLERTSQLELKLELPKFGVHQKSGRAKQSTQKSKKSDFLPIPDVEQAPNWHLGMQYFIPEWDDRVDPNYNFLTDSYSSNRFDPYTDDVYSHEIFTANPNYDGVLVSKSLIDGSQTKRSKVEELGIHNFIRFSGKIMGDCGAFSYIKENTPPYQTDEILEYYETLGFDFGVSIDHLIVGPFSETGIREWRYDLTLENAEEFLKKHKEQGYQFTPIGVAQGWSPESYASAVQELIRMGYDYIALGGLARAQNSEILSILRAVRPHLLPHIRVHLFGVARIDSIPTFRHLGVTSCDSASPLRQAWLGAAANYYTMSGKRYAAVRVPPVTDNGLRVRRLVEAGVASLATLHILEQDALKALREFGQNKLALEATLEAVLAYDELVELPRDGRSDPEAQAKRRALHEVLYREVLEEQPWKACRCPICQEIGIEVVIFRNNNRNRRRGFHNTYVFYKRFQTLTEYLTTHVPQAGVEMTAKEVFKDLQP